MTRTHLFVLGFDVSIVVPRSALDDAEATAAHVKALSRGPFYFAA